MKSLTYEEILFKFLEHHRAYSKFIRNRADDIHYSNGKGLEVYKMIIYCGFNWSSSPEGREYWSALSSKWEKITSDLNIGRNIYE